MIRKAVIILLIFSSFAVLAVLAVPVVIMAGTSSAVTAMAAKQDNGSFIWPVPGFSEISDDYGWRDCPFHGREFHNAIDIVCPLGTPFVAVSSGTVESAYYHYRFGNTVILDLGTAADGNHYTVQYCHMDSLVVQKGDSVTQGQVIGYCGMTGDTTGPHTHFVMRQNGCSVDPKDYLLKDGETVPNNEP